MYTSQKSLKYKTVLGHYYQILELFGTVLLGVGNFIRFASLVVKNGASHVVSEQILARSVVRRTEMLFPTC